MRHQANGRHMSAHPLRGSWPWRHTELFRRPQWQGPHASTLQFSAHPLRGSWPWPHRELHRGPTDAQFRHTPHEDRGPGAIRSSSDRPSGRARMRPQEQCRRTPHEDRGRGPIGSPTEGPSKLHFGTPLTRIVALAPYGPLPKVPVAWPACVPRPTEASFRHTPHEDRGPGHIPILKVPMPGPACDPRLTEASFRHTPHEDRGPCPIHGSSEGPSGGASMRPQAHRSYNSAHPSRGSWPRPYRELNRKGPPKFHFGTPLTRIVALAPMRSFSESPSGRARMRPQAHGMPISAHPSRESFP